AQSSTLDAGYAGDWSSLPLGDALAARLRFLALLHANEQLGQLVAHQVVGLECHGYRDDSRSARRAILVCQLLRARATRTTRSARWRCILMICWAVAGGRPH